MQSMTIETSSRSSISASKARSTGSRSSSSASSASERPDHSGWLAAYDDPDARPSPGRRSRSPSPSSPSLRSPLGRARGRRGSARAATQPSTPSAEQRGRQDRRRGSWWRRCTGTGRRRRRGPRRAPPRGRAIASAARPHTGREAHLRCETWRRAPRTRVADGGDRLVERAEQPVRLVAHVGRVQAAAARRRAHQRRELGGRRMHPRRVDQARRQAERPGIHRGLDLADHRRAAPGRRAARVGAEDRRRGSCPGRRGTRRSGRAPARRRRRGTRANVPHAGDDARSAGARARRARGRRR